MIRTSWGCRQQGDPAHMKCYLPGKLIRDSAPRVFIGGWSHRHPLLSQDSKHEEGKQMFGIKHLMCSAEAVVLFLPPEMMVAWERWGGVEREK